MSSTLAGAASGPVLPDYVPIPPSSLGPPLNEQGYYAGRVERNLFWVTDGTYQAAFLATDEGIVLFDAPPTIGHNLRRAVDEIAEAEGIDNTVTHLVYSHHHADHAGAADLFGNDLVRIGHEDTRRLLLRDNDPTRPAPEVTFRDTYTLRVGGERVELAFHGPNHSPDNIFIHFPDHDALMLIDIVNSGWVPIYNCNLSEDIPGYIDAPATALTYPWKTYIGGHLGRLGTREDIELHQAYIADIVESAKGALSHRRPDPVLGELRAERLGRGKGVSRRSDRRGHRARGQEVHRRSRRRRHRRVHEELNLHDPSVDAPRLGRRLAGAPLTPGRDGRIWFLGPLRHDRGPWLLCGPHIDPGLGRAPDLHSVDRDPRSGESLRFGGGRARPGVGPGSGLTGLRGPGECANLTSCRRSKRHVND